MKTLYINIKSEDIQSSNDIIVVGTSDDAIVDKFYYELGKEIVKGVDAPGIRGLAKHVVKSFKDIDELSFDKITMQWLKVKDKLLGENPTGSETIELPMEYVKWLQNYGDTSHTEIAKSLYARNRLVEISLDKIYRNSVNIIINSIEPDNYGQFVVNDEIVTDDSAISIAIMKKFDGIAFKPYKKEDVCPNCGKNPCECPKVCPKCGKNPCECIKETKLLRAKKYIKGHGLLFGYKDENNNIVIPCKFNHANDFYEGFAKVGIRNKGKLLYGYIDMYGNTMLKCECISASDFFNGIALVIYSTYHAYFIDTSFQRIWDDYSPVFDNDLSGRMVDRANDMMRYLVNYGLSPVMKEGKIGVVNLQGDVIVPFKYDRFQFGEKGSLKLFSSLKIDSTTAWKCYESDCFILDSKDGDHIVLNVSKRSKK